MTRRFSAAKAAHAALVIALSTGPFTAHAGIPVIDEANLLSDTQMTRFGPGLGWQETDTTDNLDGDGLLAPCQRERFADPDGVAALARTWEGSAERVERRTVRRGGTQKVRKRTVDRVESTAVQLVEKSRTQNDEGLVEIEKSGVKRVAVSAAELQRFREVGKAVWEEQKGKLYPPELLDTVQRRDCAGSGSSSSR